MRCSPPLVLSLCLLLPAATAEAQAPAPLPSTPLHLQPAAEPLTGTERRELETWLEGMRKWQRMDRKWHNEPAHDPLGRILARAPKPAPPDWLAARCGAFARSQTPAPAAPLGPACRMLAALEEDAAAAAIRASAVAARAAAEKPLTHTFLTRIHIDGLWTSTSSDVRVYGLVGSHISLVDVGRVQFFGPPGVILLSVPGARGSREIRAGYTWGMSVRLTDVRVFAPTKNMTLFLTMTRVWVPGGTAYDRLRPGGFDIAGFSLAPRKRAE